MIFLEINSSDCRSMIFTTYVALESEEISISTPIDSIIFLPPKSYTSILWGILVLRNNTESVGFGNNPVREPLSSPVESEEF